MSLRKELLLKYPPQLWKKSASLTLGVSDAYGPEVIFDVEEAFTTIIILGGQIVVGGLFKTGETVTTKITAYFYDGTSQYVERAATATGTLLLSESDLQNLMKDNQRCFRIGIAAKSNLASTSVTISVSLRGFEV
ncbi:MAG: hypothetical protein QXW39_07360 [Candidatus Bathyarchaeia archaeon]